MRRLRKSNPPMGLLEVRPVYSVDPSLSQNSPLSFAIFICLQCAGVHRGFGVHIRLACFPSTHNEPCFSCHILFSFVRSISMDTWQDDQVKRMQVTHNVVWCFLSAF